MKLYFNDKRLEAILSKVRKGSRLSKKDGIVLYETNDLIGVGQLADIVRQEKHQDKAYYVYNQHLNYTNICKNRCRFCAYAKDNGEKDSYVWSMEEIEKRLMERMMSLWLNCTLWAVSMRI